MPSRFASAGRVFGEEGGLDRFAERAFEPVGERDGEAAFWTVQIFVEFAGEAVAEDRVLPGPPGGSFKLESMRAATSATRRSRSGSAQLDGCAHAHLVGLLQERFGELPVEIEREQFAEDVALRAVN